MTDMIERVARALCPEPADRLGPITCDDGRHVDPGEPAWTAWIPDANVAIEAMWEPTEAMLLAGDFNPIRTAKGPWVTREAVGKRKWQAMIDEALK